MCKYRAKMYYIIIEQISVFVGKKLWVNYPKWVCEFG